jgi:hypothetical protein
MSSFEESCGTNSHLNMATVPDSNNGGGDGDQSLLFINMKDINM